MQQNEGDRDAGDTPLPYITDPTDCDRESIKLPNNYCANPTRVSRVAISSSLPNGTVWYAILTGGGIPLTGGAGGGMGGGVVGEQKKGLLVELIDGAGLEDAGAPPSFIRRLNGLLHGFSTEAAGAGEASGGGSGDEGVWEASLPQ